MPELKLETAYREKLESAQALFADAKAILLDDGKTVEEKSGVPQMIEDAQRLKTEALQLQSIKDAGVGALLDAERETKDKAIEDKGKAKGKAAQLASLRKYWMAVAQAGNVQYRGPIHPGLKRFNDPTETAHGETHDMKNAWEGEFKADMAEGVGATGGFLVPGEFLPELLAFMHENNVVRQRATVIPMRRRTISIPTLDQTGTTAGKPHQYGGIAPVWTEEAEEKDATDATFRQIMLTAHKLVCYTRASDELLDDSAIGLDAFLRSPMGFAGAILWEEEFTFLQGTGAGQPLGVINAGVTIGVPRAGTAAIAVADITDMLESFYGEDPIWHISRSQMSELLQLNGPAANPSYIFIPNGREGMPASLMGYPIEWTEKVPVKGTAGDLLLAAWRYYLIGDRQATTIDSTNIERFRYDQTSWRAVHRVDGQPWLSAPLTLQDGASQISPFVILAAKTT